MPVQADLRSEGRIVSAETRNWTEEQESLLRMRASGEPELLQVAVRADAGAGKTSVLVERARRVLAGRQSRVLCVSFTERSKKDLEERLRDEARAEVYTIHGFCKRVIDEFGSRAGLLPYPRVLDEAQAATLFDGVFDRFSRNLERNGALRSSGALSSLGFSNLRLFASHAILRGDPVDGVQLFGSGFSEEALAALRGFASTVQAEYAAQKRRRNTLDYGDLEKIALALLDGDPDLSVRDTLGKRYGHVFVDEFQDTNHTQCRLVDALRAEDRGLFVVGDVKQSIYRFRGSDCRVFERFAGAFRNQRKLSVNYRSHASVIAAVNAVFEREMPGFSPMEAGRFDAPCGGADDHPRVARVSAESDAGGVLQAVRLALEAGHRHADIALLLRRVRGNQKLLEGLQAGGLSLVLALPRELRENEVLFAFSSLWAALLLPALRMYRAHAQEVLAIQAAEISQLGAGAERWSCRRLLAEMEKRWGLRGRWGVLWESFEDLIETAHAGGHLPARVAQEFQKLWQGEAPSGIFPLEIKPLEAPSAVRESIRVSTVHSAKGLEYPVVILADLHERRRNVGRVATVQDHVWVFSSDEEGEIDRSNPAYKTAMAEEKAEAEAESLRLLYVAMTRARERLYFVDVPNAKGTRSGWGEILQRTLEGRAASVASAPASGLAVAPPAEALPEPLPPRPPLEKEEPVYRKAGMAVTRYVAEKQDAQDAGDVGDVGDAGDARPRQRAEQSRPFQRRAADLGTAAHAFLQNEDWEGLERFAREQGLDLSRFQQWMRTPQGRKVFPLAAARAGGPRYEKEFSLEWRHGSDTLVGAIDRLVVFEEEAWVLDYKLLLKPQTVRVEALRGKYAAQLALYGSAVKKMTKIPSVRLFLIDLLAASGEVCIELVPDSDTL